MRLRRVGATSPHGPADNITAPPAELLASEQPLESVDDGESDGECDRARLDVGVQPVTVVAG
jgi:hypothetical protein